MHSAGWFGTLSISESAVLLSETVNFRVGAEPIIHQTVTQGVAVVVMGGGGGTRLLLKK
jgi:hypothetical protein